MESGSDYGLVGRDMEMGILDDFLKKAMAGAGNTVLLSGEAGIGKSRLIEEFRDKAGDVKVLVGGADQDAIHPFLLFSRAVGPLLDRPLFHEQEFKTFSQIFAIDGSGLLVAQASPEDQDLDADIFAGMLSAVQDFVRDSFGGTDGRNVGLGRLEYGDMKILIEHGDKLYLTAVFRGAEHEDMKGLLKSTLARIEKENAEVLEKWSGHMDEVRNVAEAVRELAGARFFVRRNLEGIELDNERLRIADNVVSVLKQHQPFLLILEDLHWADESSLFVLNYLARNMRDSNAMILGTMRPGESDALDAVLDAMKAEKLFTFMPIMSLDGGNVEFLVGQMFPGHSLPPEFIDDISERCRGNPFFIIEMLKQMHEDGAIVEKEGVFSLESKHYSIPDSVEEVVQRRLDSLELDTMTVAEYASCIGREFERAAVMSLSSLRSPDESMFKLEKEGIIQAYNAHGKFTHALFQDIIYRVMSERWRAAYHKSIGEYFEVAYMHRHDEVLYELARHFFNSREAEKAFDYCRRAAEKAEGAFAAEQAIDFYKMAVEAGQKIKRDIGSERSDILDRMGELNSLIGDFDDALANFEDAMAGSDEPKFLAEMHRKRCDTYRKKGENETALEECGLGIDLLDGAETEGMARLLISKAYALWRMGEYDTALGELNGALEIAMKIDDHKAIANAHQLFGSIYHERGDFDEALLNLNEALRFWESMDDYPGMSIALNNLGNIIANHGELDMALDYYNRALDMANKTGNQMGAANTLNNIGTVYINKGDSETALKYLFESLDIERKVGDQRGVAISLGNIGSQYFHLKDYEKAEKIILEGIEICEKFGFKYISFYFYNNISELYLAMDDTNNAMENSQKALTISLEMGIKDGEGMSRTGLGMVYHKMGKYDEGLEELEKGARLLEELEHLQLSQTYFHMGELLADMGRKEDASEAFNRSKEWFDKMGDAGGIKQCDDALECL